ncbi:hypothetical protein CK203_006017 [Vitis vinifera]|uniref:Uncharacterized protein n=1 Tax=Vitis vinifera TaxID=29760 RepID=A0A438K5S5_VITVI|nr:hypothetical protein CK203_006017 [Vitis vinifera]
MISAVDEIRRLLESSEESIYRSLTTTICAFVAGFGMAFVFAVFIVSCTIRRLRGYGDESQHHGSTASAASSSGQRHREHVVAIPVHIYGPGPSSSCAATTSYELQACAICLCEYENGERGSDGRRRRMFGVDELLMGVENSSPPALLAPNFPSSGMTISSTRL